MTEFKMTLAGVNIEVSSLYESTKVFCSEYISDFDVADISVATDMSDILFEDSKARQECVIENIEYKRPSPAYFETLALYRKIAERMVDFDTFLFHGSAVAVDGEAYIFTAKSGTGKSTHTRLWREYLGDRAVMVNDDKPLIKITEQGTVVYGTPWCGKHSLGENISAPIKAVCILERSFENKIKKVSSKEEFPKIFSQTYRCESPEYMEKILSLLDRFLSFVSVYRLGCNMDISAAELAYKAMKGN